MHYWKDHGYGHSFATVRVYIYGLLVAESDSVELENWDMWDVFTIEWPSGKVTPVLAPDNEGHVIHPAYVNPYFPQS